MKVPILPHREEEAYQSISQRLCEFFLYYAATIISVLIAAASCRGIGVFGVLIVTGFGVDLVRRFIAPELQLSSSQRHDHIQRALNDVDYMRHCNNKYRSTVSLVYWLWGVYFVSIIFIPAMREPSAFTDNLLVRALANTASTLCPFLDNRKGLTAAFVTEDRVFMVANFLSITWWLMITATILEISGGGFYSAPKGISRIKKYHDTHASKKWTTATFTRTALILLSLIVALYYIVGLVELMEVGVVSFGRNKGQPIPFVDLARILCIFGGSFLSTAIMVRLFYNNILYRVSNILWNSRGFSQ